MENKKITLKIIFYMISGELHPLQRKVSVE